MCAVAVTNVDLVRDTVNPADGDAATADVADLAEVFTITPTKGVDKIIIEIAVANTNGTVACSLAAGDEYWARAAGALTWNCVQNKTSIMHISDIARFMTNVAAGDTIVLTLTPAAGKKLLTDHTAVVKVVQLP